MRKVFAGVAAMVAMVLAAGAAQADGDAAKGEKIYKKCKACHKIEASQNAVGPSLFGIVGRAVAAGEGFSYSDAMKAFGEGKTWTPELLETFLSDPKGTVPGTKMSFAGLKKEDDREDVIAYISTLH